MKTYHITPEAIEAASRGSRRAILITLGCITFFMLLMLLLVNQIGALTTLLILVYIWCPAGIISAMAGILANQRQRTRLSSLTLTLADDYVARAGLGRPEVRISRDEIAFIDDLGDWGLLISGANRWHFMLIPPSLEGYDELKAALTLWSSLQPPLRSRFSWWVILIVPAVSWVPIYIVTVLAVASGLFAIVIGPLYLFTYLLAALLNGFAAYSVWRWEPEDWIIALGKLASAGLRIGLYQPDAIFRPVRLFVVVGLSLGAGMATFLTLGLLLTILGLLTRTLCCLPP